MPPMAVGGRVELGFEGVQDAFEAVAARPGEVGSACCVYVDGRPVVDLWAGTTTLDGDEPYTDRTLQMVASVTKGALAIAVHRLVEQGRMDLDAPVVEYWPEFVTNGVNGGKDRIPVRWLLTHQAALPVPARSLTLADVAAWTPAVEAMEAAQPCWQPGAAHGYHAVSYGWLVGEVVRRVTGRTPGRLIRDELAEPLGLDLHVGLPASEHGRVAPLRPAPPPPPGAEPDLLTARMIDPTSLAHGAFLVPSGLFGWMNDPVLWSAELPSANGMATAHAVARMYAACLGEVDGVRLLSPGTVTAAMTEQTDGSDDLVTGYASRFGLGFQLPVPYRPMAGEGCVGHYGLGGSTGFADTRRGFAFGYTTNQMGPGVPADPRTVALIAAVVDAVG